jgi:hypothetical protein
MKVGDKVKIALASDIVLKLASAGVPPRHCKEFIERDLEVTYVDQREEWARVKPANYDTSFFFPCKWFKP